MIGWIAAVVMALIALGAVSTLWRRHQREVHHLRSAHQLTLHRLDEEHDRRLERLHREHERHLSSAHHPLAQDLLPALDSLDEALAHMERALQEDRAQSAAELHQGVALARQALDAALARHQILTIRPQNGEPFDPELHEAMGCLEADEATPNTIARLLRRGYRDGERVLRAALVEVYVEPREQSAPQVLSPSGDDDGEREAGEPLPDELPPEFDEPEFDESLEDPPGKSSR